MGGFATVERGPALWIELERPPLNILDIPTIRDLRLEIQELAPRDDLKVLVLASRIDGTFCAGTDVRDHARDRVGEMLESFHAVFHLLDCLPQVTVASVDGRCLGGGCELAAFCDLVLATPRSSFGQPEIDVGCFPPVASVLLPRLIGRRGCEMVLTGEPVDAREAERLGLITRVVDDLRGETERLVEKLAAKSGRVLALARRALRQSGAGIFGEKLARAEDLYREELAGSADAEEGVRAFLEKRPARWRNG